MAIDLKAALRAKQVARDPEAANRELGGGSATTNGAHKEQPERRIVPAKRGGPLAPRVGQVDIHRTIPHSVEAEQGVLGAMIQNAPNVIPYLRQKIGLDYFHVPAHKTVCEHAFNLFHDQGALDYPTLLTYLTKVGQLDAIGGPAFVTSLFTGNYSVAMVPHYVEILRGLRLRRQAIVSYTDLVRRAYEEHDDVGELMAEVGQKFETLKTLADTTSEDVENFGFAEMLAFDPKLDPDNLIGLRWLGRGDTCLWAGGSGFGKSTFEMQAAFYWGVGLPLFGMKPVRRLKSLIIQAENNLGDTAEQLQGVIEGIKKATKDFDPEAMMPVIRENVIIKRVLAKTGFAFCALLESLIKEQKPDLVWIDPLFAFAGCDLKENVDASKFLREGLIPIAVRNKVCLHVIHHTGKPVRDGKSKADVSLHEMQYFGFGSSEIQNAFRAVNVILPVAGHDKTFRLVLSKRGSRAGALDTEGKFTSSIYLTHAEEGICWLQIEEPEDLAQNKKSGQFAQKYTREKLFDALSTIDGLKPSEACRQLKDDFNISRATVYRFKAELQAKGLLIIRDGEWLRGKGNGS